MESNPFLGVILIMCGGLAAGSFYLPFNKVRDWAWESYWLAGGLFSWVIVPWGLAFLISPDLLGVLRSSPSDSLLWSFVFGVMWGVGGLTFGLSVRYLGMSLGMAIVLGFCASFGTLMPPIFAGKFAEVLSTNSGIVTVFGVAVCLAGIVCSGMAGISKERELTDEQKKEAIKEFNFFKGILVAIFSGIMSAGMSYGLNAGEPIAKLAMERGTPAIFWKLPVLVVVLAGGFLTNVLWCIFLNIKNRTGGDYLNAKTPLLANYLFAAIAGTTWYLQFFFYQMGESKIGTYRFSAWSLHMASSIIFSTAWGIALHEWKGTSSRTRRLVALGLAVLITSLIIVGYGNYLKPGG